LNQLENIKKGSVFFPFSLFPYFLPLSEHDNDFFFFFFFFSSFFFLSFSFRGIIIQREGKTYWFFPRYLTHLRDLGEGSVITLIKENNCQKCFEVEDHLGDFSRPMVMRSEVDLKPVLIEASNMLRSKTVGRIRKAEDLCRPFQLKPCYAIVCFSFENKNKNKNKNK